MSISLIRNVFFSQITQANSKTSSQELLEQAIRRYNDSNYEGAIGDLNGVVVLDPGNYEAWHYLGGCYHRLQNYPEAIKAYTKALEINPKSEYSFLNRGLSRHYQGDTTAAIDDYSQSLKIKREFFKSLYYRGLAHLETGNYDLANNDLSLALILDPNHFASWYLKGLAKYKKGDLEGAKNDLEQAQRLSFDKVLPGYQTNQNPFGIKKIDKGELTYPEKMKGKEKNIRDKEI